MPECCPQKLIVKFLWMDYLQDHNMLKDAWDGADGNPQWRDTGALYSPHDWNFHQAVNGNALSYSMVQTLQSDNRNPVSSSTSARGTPVYDKSNRNKMQVEIHLQVTPECACPEKCQIYGVGQEPHSAKAMVFTSGWIILEPTDDRTITLTADPFLPVRVSLLDLDIDWYIKSHPDSTQQSFPEMFNMESSKNRRYVTFGTPILFGDRESGVTLRRMDRSVEWVGNASTNDHAYVIKYLFGRFKAYTLVTLTSQGTSYSLGYSNLTRNQKQKLQDNPALLKRLGDFDWSSYFHSDVGAWPAADPELVEFGAECQAICRLVIGMLRQLGSPADLALVYATANFSDPDTAIVDGRTGNRPSGPDPSKGYTLVDRDVKKGKKYIRPVLDPSDGAMKIPEGNYRNSDDVGWNNFEAYLRYQYTENGSDKSRWYGGGVGEHTGNPIHVFWGIAEYESGTEEIWGQTVEYRLITRVHEYNTEEEADDEED